MTPFTYYYGWENVDEKERLCVLDEFAANNAQNLVLSDALLKQLAGAPQIRKQFKKAVAAAGVKFVDSHSPYGYEGDLMIPDEFRSLATARQMLTLELVHDFGVNTCCFHLGNAPLFMEYDLEQLHTFICRQLEIVLARAEKLGIIICIENIFKPLNTVSEILTLLKKFDSPYLGVCYDAGHANIMEKGMDFADSRPWGQWEGRGDVEWEHEVLDRLHDHIVICHLHDNNGAQDEHKLPGEGTVDWKYTMSMLKNAPKLLSMQSEVIPGKYGVSIRKLIDTWQPYLAL